MSEGGFWGIVDNRHFGRFVFLFPAVRKKIFNVAVGIGGQSLEHVEEVGTGFDAVAQACGEDREHDGCVFAGFVAAKEVPILPACREHLHLLLAEVIVDSQLTIQQEVV